MKTKKDFSYEKDSTLLQKRHHLIIKTPKIVE